MGGVPKTGLVLIGAVLALLGIAGFAVPVVTTQQTKAVARIGELKIEAIEEKPIEIPPVLSGAALALGVFLIGVGLYGRR